jgi:Domain of unknown function (DUF4136)
MNHGRIKLCVIVAISCTIAGFAQKVKVGYEKGTDFSKYHTYTWAKPRTIPSRPLLYDYVVSAIDGELSAKGLKKTESDGDLTLIPAGGIEYGSNFPAGTPILPTYAGPPPDMNSTMWTGMTPGSSGPVVAQGSLTIEFVDRSRNEVIWNGTVTQTLDPVKKDKSVALVYKAVAKLLKNFPPKRQ